MIPVFIMSETSDCAFHPGLRLAAARCMDPCRLPFVCPGWKFGCTDLGLRPEDLGQAGKPIIRAVVNPGNSCYPNTLGCKSDRAWTDKELEGTEWEDSAGFQLDERNMSALPKRKKKLTPPPRWVNRRAADVKTECYAPPRGLVLYGLEVAARNGDQRDTGNGMNGNP